MRLDASGFQRPASGRGRRSRAVEPGELRPADLLAGVFLLGVTYLVARAIAGSPDGAPEG